MKDRNLLCIYYECANKCSKGRGCTIWGKMQSCRLYKPNYNSKPLRIDKRRQKREKFEKGEW